MARVKKKSKKEKRESRSNGNAEGARTFPLAKNLRNKVRLQRRGGVGGRVAEKNRKVKKKKSAVFTLF